MIPEYFHYRNKSKGIFCGVCKECANAKDREYYLKNAEKKRQERRKYYEKNAEKCRQYSREYSKTMREIYPITVSEKKKRYRDAHKDEINRKQREAYHANRDEILEKRREFRKENREVINKKKRIYEKSQRKNDPIYRLKGNIRNAINDSFGRRNQLKNEFASEITGLSTQDLCDYLLKTFSDIYGYEWDGKEDVHIDHIIPLAKAKTEEEVKDLCHYSNLRLIRAEDNLKKWKKENYII